MSWIVLFLLVVLVVIIAYRWFGVLIFGFCGLIR